MKILRILRRRKIKLSFIFLLLMFFIVNTYAWMRTDKNTETGSLLLNVDDWSVAFIINNEEIKTEEYTFEIQDFYPGIGAIEKKIDVYNTGEANTNLNFEITEIYLYGEQILKRQIEEDEEIILIPETIGEKNLNADGTKTADLFGNEEASIFDENNTNYNFSLRNPTPFTISYTHDKTYISGKNVPETATSWMSINLEWDNDENNNEEDTKIGNMVYQFENAKDEEGNLLHEGEPALRIVTKVTATRVFE